MYIVPTLVVEALRKQHAGIYQTERNRKKKRKVAYPVLKAVDGACNALKSISIVCTLTQKSNVHYSSTWPT
jgi:hypothetical protein